MTEIILLAMIVAIVGEIYWGVPYLIALVLIYDFLGFVMIGLMSYHKTCPFTDPNNRNASLLEKLYRSFVIIVCWFPFLVLAIKEEYFER